MPGVVDGVLAGDYSVYLPNAPMDSTPQLYVTAPYVTQSTNWQPMTFNLTVTNSNWDRAFYDQLCADLMRDYQATTSWQMLNPNTYYLPSTMWTTMTAATGNIVYGSMVPETPEQKAERRRQAKLDDLAAARAKELLLEHLDDVQRAEYEEKQFFHVIGQSGKLYRIRHGSVGNVYEIGLDGNEKHKFCIHARHALPACDNMLAQYLLLRYDEEQFMATANKHY